MFMKFLERATCLTFLSAITLASKPALSETPIEPGCSFVEAVASCVNCHIPKGPNVPLPGKRLAGGDVIKHHDFTAVAPNITPDRETGIGSWTDQEVVAAIRD